LIGNRRELSLFTLGTFNQRFLTNRFLPFQITGRGVTASSIFRLPTKSKYIHGDINEGFYSSMVKMFDQVAMECDRDEELYKAYSTRLLSVLSKAEGTGWWFHEALEESYYTIEWVHDENEDEDE
jgi:hypothetical protein